MKRLLRFIIEVIRKSIKDKIDIHSANVAFFVTVSFVPFIMLLIGMVRFLPLEESTVIGEIVAVFPKGARPAVSALIAESYDKSGAVLISITAITTLWAASIGVHALVTGLNLVFNEHETRNFFLLRIMSMIYTLLLMALLLSCLIFFVFGNTIVSWLSGHVPWMFEYAPLFMSLRIAVGVVVLTIFFVTMYTVIPARKTKFYIQIPGALLSAVGWIGCSGIFSHYYENISNFSYLYSSLSVIVFFMLWLFFCMCILFVGAEVNRCIEERLERKALLS